ncbi:hypothetical protein CC1G_15603 [Coprinopsis cinerea okayama7|uniref:F-box domain-containing protein n=1 Tax=Coprinopsis cinerea (strain Okayama-7 / 130 / ATCC MYA-4618 / FGSC 9003) TaxID=240176 RepID=D6RND3_COPC7|nr:hypothetical protein CC1G_15603 [Coprinopsis cinerea okayama7\|eukprot:XP_002911061.1 hypothetical protein CC1G_15603 [Coprinopsis cinerea okayama7\
MGVEAPPSNPSAQPGITRTSARDALLSNEDLLDIIFEFVQEAYVDGKAFPQTFSCNQQLLHLALTHKGFRDSALKVLWRTIPGLLPLFKLIPEFERIDGVYMFTNTLDLDKLSFYYAKHVKSISFAGQGDIISPLAYQVWPTVSGRTDIPLPTLRKLRIDCSASTCDYAGALFVASTVQPRLLSIEVVGMHPTSSTFLRQLNMTLCLRHRQVLQEVTLEGDLSAQLLQTILVHLCSTKVSRLKIDIRGEAGTALFKKDIFSLLCHLPNLTHLSLKAPDAPLIQETGPRPQLEFPLLRTLSFNCTPPLAACALHWMISAPSLLSVELETYQGTFLPLPETKDCLNRFVQRAIAHPTVPSIRITQPGPTPLHLPFPADLGISKSPTNLQHLFLGVHGISNTSAFIATLARICPRLVSLVLPATSLDPYYKKPDLTSLAVLAKGCPDLLDIRISLRLHRITPKEYSPQHGFPGERLLKSGAEAAGESISSGHPLKSLGISDAGGDQQFGVTDCISMAQYIHRLFPKLDRLEGYRDAAGGGSGRKETFEALQELISVMGRLILSQGV